MKNIPARLTAAAFIFAVTVPVVASGLNLRWLQYSPVRYFNDEDWRLGRKAAKEALDDAPDGTTISWENAESGASGSSTPLKTITKDGSKCRYLKIKNSANDTTGAVIYLFCRQEDGTWRVAPR